MAYRCDKLLHLLCHKSLLYSNNDFSHTSFKNNQVPHNTTTWFINYLGVIETCIIFVFCNIQFDFAAHKLYNTSIL